MTQNRNTCYLLEELASRDNCNHAQFILQTIEQYLDKFSLDTSQHDSSALCIGNAAKANHLLDPAKVEIDHNSHIHSTQ
jgi:hypothetical protein